MRRHLWLLVAFLSIWPGRGVAQTVRPARLLVTITDPSGGVLPHATVTVVRVNPDTPGEPLSPSVASDAGIATFERLPPGRYAITAAFPGFMTNTVDDVRLRAGDNRQTIVLALEGVEASVSVGRDPQERAADRRAVEFGRELSPSEIAGLPDDPGELARRINELVGPDAIIRVDGFEGQQLPPKSQITAVHIIRDQFAAEVAQPGSTFVDIITQPGNGPLRGNVDFNIQDGALSGTNAFTGTRAAERQQVLNGSVSGSIVPGKTGFSSSMTIVDRFATPILNAALPDGSRAETLGLRQPSRQYFVSGQIDHALTSSRTLRVAFTALSNADRNLGVGSFDLPERAFTHEQRLAAIRVQEAGPLGSRSFINTRLSYTRERILDESVTDAPAIIVLDAFNRGGAQQGRNVHAQYFMLASDVDHVRGKHAFRAGFQLDAQRFRSVYSMNLLGTYTFSSLEAFESGQPATYTRFVGTPLIDYTNVWGAVYVQDDITVRKGLTMSPGLRYSLQKGIADRTAFEPRFGTTWSPSASGRTTLRASVGVFTSFLGNPQMDQILRQNGEAQREILLLNPSYPDPGVQEPTRLPTNKYLLGDFTLQPNLRYSLGVDQRVVSGLRVNLLYQYVRQFEQARGRNLNAPVNGVRPDPRFGNIIEAVTDTEIRRHEVRANATINLAGDRPPSATGPRIDWRRVGINGSYAFVHARNNSGGFFEVSPTGNADNDWGPGPADAPYRASLAITSAQVRNLTGIAYIQANSNTPYTLTTGLDDNHDGFLNDRPAGVGLRTLRGAGQAVMHLRAAYRFAPGGKTGASGAAARRSLEVFVVAVNVTNRVLPVGYSGNRLSEFFMRPTATAGPRRVYLGANVGF